MTTPVSRRPAWLLIAAAGLVLAWLAAPAAPPLYDGVGFPDEPFRYVNRPPGDTTVTKPPSAVTVRMPVTDGTTDGFNASSAEQGPQISVFVPTGTLAAPDAHTLLLQADPRAPDGPADGGPVDGNVYRLTATADVGKPAVAKVPNTIQIVMRATTAKQPGPIMEYRPIGAKRWTRLNTSRYGNEVYAASAEGFGDYALVFAKPLPGAKPTGKSGPAGYAGVLILAGLLILLVSVVLGIRLARARRAALATQE